MSKLTAEKIVAIYNREISYPNRAPLVKQLQGYLDGTRKQRLWETYKRAARIIKAQQTNGHAVPPPVVTEPTTDPYAKLAKGQQMVNEAIIEIAELEANKRSDEKVKELKAKYEKELQRYQAIIAEMKDSSAVGMLRRHFGNS